MGGFIKEYAVDNAVKIVKKSKIEAALINFGGDIYALGIKPNGYPFKISIKNPLDRQKYVEDVFLSNQALATSASYERNKTIEGKVYSHIMHIQELQTHIISSSVISSSVLESGVYSTALMVNPVLNIPFKKILADNKLHVTH